jgi:hypothetical protein
MVGLHADKGYRDVIFPPTYVYPLGNKQMFKPPYDTMPWNSDEKIEKMKNDLVRPETFAIHWWQCTWCSPAANVKD